MIESLQKHPLYVKCSQLCVDPLVFCTCLVSPKRPCRESLTWGEEPVRVKASLGAFKICRIRLKAIEVGGQGDIICVFYYIHINITAAGAVDRDFSQPPFRLGSRFQLNHRTSPASSNQSINQAIHQSINQPESINQSINQSSNQPTNQPINQSNQPINQPTNQPIDQPINQSTNQPNNKSINHAINQPTNAQLS